MFTIVVHLFQWRTTTTALLRLRLSDAVIIYAVTAISVAVDLAIGVAVGIVLHALVFAYDMSKRPQFIVAVKWHTSAVNASKAVVDAATVVDVSGGVTDTECRITIRGVLYFGSVHAFVSGCHPDVLLSQLTVDVAATGAAEASAAVGVVSVVLDMRDCGLLDFSASCAMDDVVHELRKRGWSVEVSGVVEQQRMRLSLAQAITPSKQTLTWPDDSAEPTETRRQ